MNVGYRLRVPRLIELDAQMLQVHEGAGNGKVGKGQLIADEISASLRNDAFVIVEDRRQLLALRRFGRLHVAGPPHETGGDDTVEEHLRSAAGEDGIGELVVPHDLPPRAGF